MKDIPMKRILRLYLAAFICLFFVANVLSNEARAESGSITVTNTTTGTFQDTAAALAHSIDFTRLYYDNLNISEISFIRLSPRDGATATFVNDFESTTGTITGNGSGTFTAWYDKNFSYFMIVFASGSTFTATGTGTSTGFLNLTYTKNIWSNVTFESQGGSNTDFPSAAQPVMMGDAFYAGYNCCRQWIRYNYSFSSSVTDAYVVTYTGNIFTLNVTKGKNVATLHTILRSSGTYSTGTLNILDYAFSNPYLDGLALKVQNGAGDSVTRIINTTNYTGFVAPVNITVDPVTGVGIVFDSSTYSIGGTANISWSRTSPTPFGFQDDIYLIQPTTTGSTVKKILVSSPPDSGYVKTNDFPIAGGYNVSFERSVLGLFPEVLASDTATVISESASYILVNATVPVGVYTDGTYLYGWNGSGRIVIYQDMSDGTVKEISSLPINATCCIEHTVPQLFFPEPGNYRVVLMKGFDTVKASVSVVAYLSDIVPGANITVSNISLNKIQYTYGEPYTITYQVDSFNYSNKAKRIIAYEVSTGANTLINQVPAQTGTITRTFDSEAYPFSGALQLRLMGLNSSGDYLLAYVNFTLSRIDTEGYGLDVTKSPICIKETGYFTYYSPSPVTISIADRDFTVYSKNLTSAISGKTVPFTINRAGNYEIFLRPNNSNDVKFTKIIEVKACNVSAQTPVSGAGQAQQVAAAITTPVFWALIITAGLMIAIAWKTRDGFAAGSIGMLSAGVFAFMSWLPLWIFFSALIIAALLISSSIVSKQLKKTG